MTRSSHSPSRRLFLRQSAAFSALGAGAAPIAMNLAAIGAAAAQSTQSDYKALVCVFLAGGNDAYNTVLATDSASWQAYVATRNQQPTSIALASGSLKALSPSTNLAGRSLALHPQLGGLQRLFNTDRKLAVVSNIGPLVEPLTKDQYTQRSKRAPQRLFSHNDQQSTWQALSPEDATSGWGGRLADLLTAESPNGNGLFSGISAAGNAVWVSGKTVKQYQMQPAGAIRLGVSDTGIENVFGSQIAAAKLQSIAQRATNRHAFQTDLADVGARSIQAERTLRGSLPAASSWPYGGDTALMYTKPDGTVAQNSLAAQLQAVARTIGARTSLGMKRQVFFVSLGGFDTHDDQLTRHADAMAKLNHALVYFDSVLSSMGVSDSVTTFTASDFGRSFTSNGNGTDHGWGGHQFVMGGAVKGGTVLGKLPVYGTKNVANNNFDNSPDQLANGALLPSTSVEQLGVSLGRWMNASETMLQDVFPNLYQYQGSRGLDLMKT